jgi:hypothetical protein
VLVWLHLASRFDRPVVVMSTAYALVDTGDINLIRDDSLRTAVVRYIQVVEQMYEFSDLNARNAVGHVDALSGRVDYGEAMLADLARAERNPLARADAVPLARADLMYPFPDAPARTPIPLDVDALVRDREAYVAAWNLWRRRSLLRQNRTVQLDATTDLLAEVETELDR